MKKISIIVPCYGTEAYVEKCLESLFKQTYKNLEIIAVNDCSKGNMQEILDNLKIKDSRLKVITNTVNKGLFHSRIIGSKEATGDYIAFVDSDDYVDKDFYRLLVNNINENDSDIVISNLCELLFVNSINTCFLSKLITSSIALSINIFKMLHISSDNLLENVEKSIDDIFLSICIE